MIKKNKKPPQEPQKKQMSTSTYSRPPSSYEDMQGLEQDMSKHSSYEYQQDYR